MNKRIKQHGNAKGHTYSPLLIQFAVMLRDKCSASSYDFFRKAFNLPTNRTLCRYSNADSTSPDGLMMETIIQMATIYDELNIPELHWSRYLNLAWDSHTIRDHLGYCPHTKRLVGYSDDAFDIDVIRSEFNRRTADAADSTTNSDPALTDTQDDSNPSLAADGDNGREDMEDSNDISLGKHYMVFMCQAWSKSGGPSRFMVARYCLGGLTSRWIRSHVLQITSA